MMSRYAVGPDKRQVSAFADRHKLSAAGAPIRRALTHSGAVALLLDDDPAVAVCMSAGKDHSLGIRLHEPYLLFRRVE